MCGFVLHTDCRVAPVYSVFPTVTSMPRVLLTAFEPYEPWPTNASWLALIELTRELPSDIEITTRLYPVELESMKQKLAEDLKARYDFAFHIGQEPKSSCLKLEEVALNVASKGHSIACEHEAIPVCSDGPDAYRSQIPVRQFAKTLRSNGIPTRVSFHAGTYLCNASLYWSCRLADDLNLRTKSTFVHVPLDTSQVLELDEQTPFMPSSMVADGLRMLIQLATSELPQQLV